LLGVPVIQFYAKINNQGLALAGRKSQGVYFNC
jgi:hypothetical protein